MKRVLMGLVVMASVEMAYADGFECSALDQAGTVKVYNHVSAENGTRVGSVMILSNPEVKYPRKTVAVFRHVNHTLTTVSKIYTGDVDLRYREISRKGENFLGTKLGELDQVVLAVDHNYSQPVAEGEYTSGLLTLVKRDGDRLEFAVECQRYLKSE